MNEDGINIEIEITGDKSHVESVEAEVDMLKEYPELEDITIIPTIEGQELKPNKYGYSKIIIEAIPATDLKIEPKTEEQITSGIFKNVIVEAIKSNTLNLNPSEEQQSAEGVFTKVNINPIQVEEITTDLDFSNSDEIELTSQDGSYIKKAIINKPTNLIPENIKSGKTVCGIDGVNADTSDADATSDDIKEGKTAYVNNEKVVGTMTVKNYNALIDTTISAGSSNSSGLNALIREIPNLIINGTSATYMFSRCTSLEEITTLDTSNVTNMSYMFLNCTSLKSIPEMDTSKVTTMAQMFYNCSSLISIPNLNTSLVTDMASMFSGCSNLTEIPQLNTNNVIAMGYMFNNCTSLVTVPVLNTKSLVSYGMNSMFKNCTALSDESLNNILQMCINATKITTVAQKCLSYIGLTSEQATRCTGLSNYTAFTSAGWVTGY